MRISIWVTSLCNLKCKYCYENNSNSKNNGEMKREVEEELLVWLNQRKLELINFHGGEPLLNFKLIKRIVEQEYKKNHKIKFSMTTNGTIWNDEIKEFFIKYKKNFEGWISVSIDGTKENTDLNRINHKNDSIFEDVLNTGLELMNIFPKLRARMTIAPNTIDKINENINFLINQGFKQISAAFDFFNKNWTNDDLEIIEREYSKVIKSYINNPNIEIGLIDEIKFRKKIGRCDPNTNIYINGNIYACTFEMGNSDYIIGSIYEGIDKKSVNKIKKESNFDNKECQECTIKDSCSINRCKILNKSITGCFSSPIPIGCALENIKVQMYLKYKKKFNLI